MKQNHLLEVRHLKKYFPMDYDFWGRPQKYLKAVDDVTFAIRPGETLGLVGESGCGKSTTGRAIIHLYEPTSVEIVFDGQKIEGQKAVKNLRRQMQMIFQDPYASLNPRMTVSDIIGEPIDIHRLAAGKERQERILSLLQQVGLNPEHSRRFPHEFSGGQRQRIGIARALAIEPRLIICDEPISALDVSIQAQVVNLLMKLQEDLGLAYLFIAHDLAMVKHISQRIAVMYLGKIVEITSSSELYQQPLHPYTQALLSAIPIPDPVLETKRQRLPLSGELPNPADPPSGCTFRTRCPLAKPLCQEESPKLQEVSPGHEVACHFYCERRVSL